MIVWSVDWYCLFGWDWLYSMSVWQYNVMHTSSTVCQRWDLLKEFPQRCGFLFLNIRSSIHSFVVRRACCEFNFQYDSFTVVLLDIRSDTWWLVLHCQISPKSATRKTQVDVKEDQKHCHPCSDLWLVSQEAFRTMILFGDGLLRWFWHRAAFGKPRTFTPANKDGERGRSSVVLFFQGKNPPCVRGVMSKCCHLCLLLLDTESR